MSNLFTISQPSLQLAVGVFPLYVAHHPNPLLFVCSPVCKRSFGKNPHSTTLKNDGATGRTSVTKLISMKYMENRQID